MKAPKDYQSPEAFRTALQDRSKEAARKEEKDINRFRQELVFDRLLARVFSEFGEQMTLKGGVALAARLVHARMTKDVDLRLKGLNVEAVLPRLQEAGQRDFGDHFTFEIQPYKRPTLKGPRYDGKRFGVRALIAGKTYMAFHMDVGVADALVQDPEVLEGTAFFQEYFGLPRTELRVYPREAHIAEKLHAYTFEYGGVGSSRVRDLPDIVILGTSGPFVPQEIRNALGATFGFRGTHEVPKKLPEAPKTWVGSYSQIAMQNPKALAQWPTLPEVEKAAGEFLNPILDQTAQGNWNPKTWTWDGAP